MMEFLGSWKVYVWVGFALAVGVIVGGLLLLGDSKTQFPIILKRSRGVLAMRVAWSIVGAIWAWYVLHR